MLLGSRKYEEFLEGLALSGPANKLDRVIGVLVSILLGSVASSRELVGSSTSFSTLKRLLRMLECESIE